MQTKTTQHSYHNPRMVDLPGCNAYEGQVKWSATKSLWVTGMTVIGVIGGAYTVSYANVMVFLSTTAVTLCLGHSLGMHRRFIHKSYECPKWLEYLFVYLGVLVGLAGPMGMMYTHDLRDWAQRQRRSHPYFGHKAAFLKDGFWQMHCEIKLDHPPEFIPEATVRNDRFYCFIEMTWMWQQLPIAFVLLCIGGIDWVIWGVCLRVMVSVMGHWLIGYVAHNTGQRHWHVEGASVQGYNIRFCGLITMGECWHNNHHAFPESAQLGIEKNQTDPGWWMLLLLKKMGLVWQIKKPEDLPARVELVPIRI